MHFIQQKVLKFLLNNNSVLNLLFHYITIILVLLCYLRQNLFVFSLISFLLPFNSLFPFLNIIEYFQVIIYIGLNITFYEHVEHLFRKYMLDKHYDLLYFHYLFFLNKYYNHFFKQKVLEIILIKKPSLHLGWLLILANVLVVPLYVILFHILFS